VVGVSRGAQLRGVRANWLIGAICRPGLRAALAAGVERPAQLSHDERRLAYAAGVVDEGGAGRCLAARAPLALLLLLLHLGPRGLHRAAAPPRRLTGVPQVAEHLSAVPARLCVAECGTQRRIAALPAVGRAPSLKLLLLQQMPRRRLLVRPAELRAASQHASCAVVPRALSRVRPAAVLSLSPAVSLRARRM